MKVTARFPNNALMSVVVRSFEYARFGDLDGARNALEQLAPDSPMLACFGPHIRYLAQTCARLGDVARSEPIYRSLLGYENRMGSWGRVGMVVEGPNAWLLGICAGTLGRFEDASRHFEDALTRCVRAGMRPYEAITCLDYARVLTAWGPEHRARRDDLVRRGAAIADELGMGGIRAAFDDLMLHPGEAAKVRAATPEPRDAAPPPAFSMKKDGDLWAIESSGRVRRVKDSRGMQMLAELALHPNREFHVLTLAGSDLVDAGDAGDVIDRQAAQAYRARLEDLRDQLEEAESFGDQARATRIRDERDRIAEELARGTGLGGRTRRAGAAAERARINVQRRLREAIRRIGEHDAKLGRFLDRAVRTGTFCAYEPE
jgi:hypothetical protein